MNFIFCDRSYHMKYFQHDYATSWVGHLAGGLTGILLGIVVLKNRRVEKWETWLKLVCVLSYTAAIITMITANIFVSNCEDGCFFKEEWNLTKYEEVRNSFEINCTWYQVVHKYLLTQVCCKFIQEIGLFLNQSHFITNINISTYFVYNTVC